MRNLTTSAGALAARPISLLIAPKIYPHLFAGWVERSARRKARVVHYHEHVGPGQVVHQHQRALTIAAEEQAVPPQAWTRRAEADGTRDSNKPSSTTGIIVHGLRLSRRLHAYPAVPRQLARRGRARR